jgi:polysaccharide biosynthesis/export protein
MPRHPRRSKSPTSTRGSRCSLRPTRSAAQAVPVAATFHDGPYTLDSGDKLRIVVFGQDTLSNNYTVDAQGQVNMPLIGAVSARGLTTAQLAASITSRLKTSFIRDPSVAVEIETYRPFFVLGEVTFPGQYPYVPNMTVENAIAIAGGFTPRAYKDKVTITRKAPGGELRYKLPLRNPIRPHHRGRRTLVLSRPVRVRRAPAAASVSARCRDE